MILAKRLVEGLLRPYDNEDRELIVRWRMWTHRWFPYRTAEFRGYDEEMDELVLGPWEWHAPDNLWKRNASWREVIIIAAAIVFVVALIGVAL